MIRYYNPDDPNSSQFEPAMGDIVIYRGFRNERAPAIVNKSYDDDACDLTVFGQYGIRYVIRVKYSSNEESENTYGWMPEKVARPTIEANQSSEVA